MSIRSYKKLLAAIMAIGYLFGIALLLPEEIVATLSWGALFLGSFGMLYVMFPSDLEHSVHIIKHGTSGRKMRLLFFHVAFIVLFVGGGGLAAGHMYRQDPLEFQIVFLVLFIATPLLLAIMTAVGEALKRTKQNK